MENYHCDICKGDCGKCPNSPSFKSECMICDSDCTMCSRSATLRMKLAYNQLEKEKEKGK